MSIGRGRIWVQWLLLVATLAATPVRAVDSAFTYQGQLKQQDVPADGPCDLRFELFDAAIDGGQIGAAQTYTDVVLADGLFTLQLNFGGEAFDGNDRWLQIATRCPAGAGAFAMLTPRQPLTATPYALFASSIADEAVTSAKLADGAVGTAQLAAGAVTGDKVANGSLDESAVGFNYAGSTSKAGPATDLVCGACVDVDELSTAGSLAGQVPTATANGVEWRAPFELPFTRTVSVPIGIAAFEILLTSSQGSAVHLSTATLNTSAPLLLAEYNALGGVAIEGRAASLTSGGVLGSSTGSLRAGVEGSAVGNGGTAVQGTAQGTNGIGVRGVAANGTTAKAVHGVSSNGFAGYFEGRVLIDADTGDDPLVVQTNGANVARIDDAGKGFFDGGTMVGGADVAEFVPTSDQPGPGDVVEIDPDSPGRFRRAATANSPAVAGVISTEPGVSLNAAQGAAQAASGPQ
ncbi:MAG: hypothetical protein ACRERC_03100 [Candidatus Binatia bacterium]